MKNKNRYLFRQDASFLAEKRLIFMAGPETPEAQYEAMKKSPGYDKALNFIGTLHPLEHIEGGENPVDVLKDNPFAQHLVDWSKDLTDNDLIIDRVDSGQGTLTIHLGPDENGRAQEPLVIDDLAYIALYWKEIGPALEQGFAAAGVTLGPALLREIARTQPENFMKMLNEIAKYHSKRLDPALLAAAVAEVEAIKPRIAPSSKKAREVTGRRIEEGEEKRKRAKAERASLKTKVDVKLPTKPTMKTDEFVEIVNTKDGKNLDRFKIHVLNEGHEKVNAQKWSHTTVDGVKDIYRDMLKVGIPVGEPFYQNMFNILRKSATKPGPFLGDPEHAKWFLDPKNHLDDLRGLGDDGAEFAAAFEQLEHIKKLLVVQDTGYMKTLAKQEGMDSPKVARVVSDALRDNYAAFSKAVREKDWATAGVYVLGIVAIYKSVKNLSKTEGGGKALKWLTYGAAAYAGAVMLDNAGYDILKMTGFKNNDYMLEGTPLATMKRILRDRPGMQNMAEDFDYEIALRMSEVNLADLHKLYEKSNEEGIRFIHPYQFSAIFPDLAKEWPFDMAMGENGLKDYVGAPNMSIKPGQRRYVETGKQIYNLAVIMREVYEGTLMKDHPEYKGEPYETAVVNHQTRGLGKVRHLLGAMEEYAPERPAKGLLSSDKIVEAHETLRAAFKDAYGIGIEPQPNEKGDYTGTLMGYPIVLVPLKGKYRIYLKEDYKGGSTSRDYIAEVPLKAGAESEREAMKAVAAVQKKMDTYIKAFNLRSVDGLPRYESGKWFATVDLSQMPGAAAFGLSLGKKKVEIIPYTDGKGVALRTIDGGVRINLHEEVMKQYPLSAAIIPSLISQREGGFHALKVFDNARRLRVDNVDAGSKEFDIIVGANNAKARIKYVGGKFQFVSPAEEAALVQNTTFSQEYVEALGEDDLFELEELKGKIAGLITKSPEKFWAHLWESITGQTKDSPLDGWNLDAVSSSVPDYFANAVLDVAVYESYQKLRRRIQASGSLEDVEDARKDELFTVQTRLSGVYDVLATEVRDMKNWDREEFMTRVIEPIRASSTNSSVYANSKRGFEYEAYSMASNGFTNSDFDKSSHKRAGDLLKVYAYYTAHLDNPDYTYTIPGTAPVPYSPGTYTEKIALDDLKMPPQALYEGVLRPQDDPGLRGHYIKRYFEYVKTTVITEATGKEHFGNAPSFNVMEFDVWLERAGSYAPLDAVDNQPQFQHNASKSARENHKFSAGATSLPESWKETQLERAIKDEFKRAVGFLRSEYATELNWHAVEEYLNATSGKSGILKVGQVEINGNKLWKSQLWDWSERISKLPTRGEQLKEIMKLVDDHLIQHIFSKEHAKKFFRRPISLKARVLQKWPSLADIPLLPNWINPLSP